MCRSNQSFQALLPELKSLILSDRASSTASTYLRGFQRWCRWSSDHDIPSLPGDGRHVALFLTDLAQRSRSTSSVLSTKYAVSWAHRKALLPDPTTHPLVVQVCEACRRVYSKPVKKKKPLSALNVQDIARQFGAPGTSLRHLQGVVIVVLGFVGFLRWNDLSQIQVEGIRVHKRYMSVFLEKRKNDQFHKGNYVYFHRSDALSCPVSVVERFLLRSGLTSGPLLREIVGSGHREHVSCHKLKYSSARWQILKMFKAIGLKAGEYGLHSLRSGGASAASKQGVSDRLIARHGGWRTYQSRDRYIRDSRKTVLSVSKALFR